MSSIATNAGEIEDRYRKRVESIQPAVRNSVRRAALLVDKAATKRLTGSGAPWSYPVPVRTGFLRRSQFVQQPEPTMAVVGNSAAYANAIHTGLVSQWAGRGKHRTVQQPARPFLDDAVKDVDPVALIRTDIIAALDMAI